MAVAVNSAREELVRAVLRLVASERDDPHANYDAELEYAQDWVDSAAFVLAEALNGPTPASGQPRRDLYLKCRCGQLYSGFCEVCSLTVSPVVRDDPSSGDDDAP